MAFFNMLVQLATLAGKIIELLTQGSHVPGSNPANLAQMVALLPLRGRIGASRKDATMQHQRVAAGKYLRAGDALRETGLEVRAVDAVDAGDKIGELSE